MSNNWIADNGTNNLTFTTGADDTITFTASNANTTELWLPDPLINWLPKASERKKYFPSWHLVRSYE